MSEAILTGEPPHDIVIRWKSLAGQPLGWNPDPNDGMRMNIRSFIEARVLAGKVNVKWVKDRQSARNRCWTRHGPTVRPACARGWSSMPASTASTTCTLPAPYLTLMAPDASQRHEPRCGVRFDRAAYRERNQVERTITRLKQYRAIATRYEKLAETYQALITLAAIQLWLPV